MPNTERAQSKADAIANTTTLMLLEHNRLPSLEYECRTLKSVNINNVQKLDEQTRSPQEEKMERRLKGLIDFKGLLRSPNGRIHINGMSRENANKFEEEKRLARRRKKKD